MFPPQIAAYVFAVAIVYAPYAHGCATAQAWFVLDALCVLGFLVQVGTRIAERKAWVLPWFPCVAMVLLLALGIAQATNPKYIYDPVTRGMEALTTFRPGIPGTMDQRSTVVALVHWASLGLGFLALLDLLRHRESRWFLLAVISLAGVTISAFGIALKFQGSVVIPFTDSRCNTFFGPYVYHAHAAAFLNLCWPASMVLAIRSLYGDQPVGRAIWINVFLLIFLALFINISKFGHLIALPALAFAFVVVRKAIPMGQARVSPLVLAVIGLILLGAAAMLVLPLVGVSINRWDEMMRSGAGGRPILWEIAGSIIRQFPLWGTGTGTFYLVFPYFSGHLGNSMQGLFSHAHQDYLQTVVEWGIPGAAVWFALIGGGFLKGCREHWRRPEELSTGAALIALTILGVHAAVDFPVQIGSLRLYAAVYLAMLWRNKRAPRAGAVES